MVAERKYALTKLAAGDYVFPSNHARVLWRVAIYIDGPSTGLDWSSDRKVWGLYRYTDVLSAEDAIDTSWDCWEMVTGTLPSRAEAIAEALNGPS